MKLPIILIGPMYSGKSTLANLLSEKLGLPIVAVDELADKRYEEKGLDGSTLQKARNSSDFHDFVALVRPYEIAVAVEIVNEHKDSIISFGAGHSYVQDKNDLKLLLSLKDSTPNIFLILPSSDTKVSKEILEKRIDSDEELEERRASKKEVNEQFLAVESNQLLAYKTIYTEGHTPQETCEEIIGLLS